jgi:hypothetical protein
MRSEAGTVKQYLEELPAERRRALSKIRNVIRKSLPRGIEESMNWGMICYEVPLATYPGTYNKKPLMYAALASQKNHMAVYLSCIYSDSDQRKWFENAYRETGKKLDMGKSCVRFKNLEDLPLELIGEAISRIGLDEFISYYEETKKR